MTDPTPFPYSLNPQAQVQPSKTSWSPSLPTVESGRQEPPGDKNQTLNY
jgi:hypothetical protein